MDKVRVFVATTAGPSEILALTEEDPRLHSVICLRGSELDLPISPSYHRFVRDPTGIIERHFGHGAWRMDVSERIEMGDSWKLAVVAAHALHAASRLAQAADPEARQAIWLTGAVLRNLSVEAVGHIPEKLIRSEPLFAELAARGVQLRLFLPAEDAATTADAAFTTAGIAPEGVHRVRHVDEVAAAIGVPPLAHAQAHRPAVRTNGRAATEIPAGLDFSAFLAERIRGFVGRDWLLRSVSDWLDSNEQVLLITGDPGAGKSALAARLIDAGRGGAPGAGSRIAAYYCCQADSPATLEPAQFVRTLAAMLARWRPEVAAVLGQAGPVEFLAPSAISNDPASALDLGILAPLSHLPPPDRRHALVIDALDESLAPTDSRTTIADLLARWVARFPPWLKLVGTSRPLPQVLTAFTGARQIEIARADARNVADIRAFVRTQIEGLAGAGTDAARRAEEQVVARADGNMLCARQMLEAVAKGDGSLEAAADLPHGLAGIYRQAFMRSWPTEQSYWPARNVLATLIAAREPLSLSQLAAIAAANGDVLSANTIDALAGYVRQVGGRLVLYHQSLAEWLTSPDRASGIYWIDPRLGLARLAAYCRQWRAVDDSYPLLHLTAHLRALGAVDELGALMAAGEFAAVKSARSAYAGTLRDDYRNLAASLLTVGRDAEAAALARTKDPACRDGLLAALVAAGLPITRARRIVAAMMRGDLGTRRRATSPEELSCWRVGVGLACALPLEELILVAADHGSALVRAILVPQLYRLWQQQPELGWSMLTRLGARISGRLGLPRPGVFEVVGGVSLAILGWHYDDAQAMRRLQRLWQTVVHALAVSPVARVGGQGWIVALLVSILRLVMARQPAYQPLNLTELAATFGRPSETRRGTGPVIDCLAEPERGPEPILRALTDPELPFDIHLMLVAERALILQGDRDPAMALEVLAELHRRGCPWFRQSALYAGFHILKDAGPSPALADQYVALARETIAEHRATFATGRGTYLLIPHMAWPEIVLDRHRPGTDGARFLPELIEAALRSDDIAYAGRVIRACEILSHAYGHHALALDALRAHLSAPDFRLHDVLAEVLANIRFRDEAGVDDVLRRHAPAWLADRVAATTPTVTAADFPTWIDAFMVHLLRSSPPFRHEVAGAFRRAANARSLGQLLRQVVPWMIYIIADGTDLSAAGSGPR